MVYEIRFSCHLLRFFTFSSGLRMFSKDKSGGDINNGRNQTKAATSSKKREEENVSLNKIESKV